MASVGQNSPAAKAGIKAGDIILEFDGKKINTMKWNLSQQEFIDYCKIVAKNN